MTKANKVPLFQPRKRFALLVNCHEQIAFRTPLRMDHGNSLILRMEAALRRGFPDLTMETRQDMRNCPPRDRKMSAASAIKEAKEKYDAYLASLGSPKTVMLRPFEGFTYDYLPRRLFGIYKYALGDIRPQAAARQKYDLLQKLRVGVTNGGHLSYREENQIINTLNSFNRKSDKHSLTILFLTGHGDGESTGGLEYSSLLEQMQYISGKKVIFNFSCRSAGLINFIKGAPTRGDYFVFSVSEAKKLSYAATQDLILSDLIEHILANRPLGEFVCHRYSCTKRQYQTPVIFRGFDVVL